MQALAALSPPEYRGGDADVADTSASATGVEQEK
jgi:hypothetical protein